MRRIMVVTVAALSVAFGGLAVALSRSPATVVAANSTGSSVIATTRRSLSACQTNEALPSHVSAIRLHIFASLGPRVVVTMLAHGHVITQGERGPGWTSGSVTVPVKALNVSLIGLTLCFALDLKGNETVDLHGDASSPLAAATSRNAPLPGRLGVEYLRAGDSSWPALSSQVAWRMGLGQAWSGAGSVILAALAMAALIALSMRIILRELK